ncbi:hypothetical protein BJ875DRAFT_459992 [Amylocarpus encephaloides]|uniref:Uncharacterized protein n=1 Tax=Amylocarpus encephaloides TaxID=45428 RepID=A0A9P8C5Z4_9HELO|nr:hypothetical protein BJ875DRAFT_459992 [Amylocarpus encephaloides]
MSSQPSTIDDLKNTAAAAADKVSNSLSASDPNYDENKDKNNFSRDTEGNVFKKGDYKHQLNEAAHGGPKKPEESYVEKVMSRIPGVRSIQQHTLNQGSASTDAAKRGPPDRPNNDVQVEEFLRKQYHSKSGDVMPNPDSE